MTDPPTGRVDPAGQVADLSTEQLHAEAANLRLLADRLDAFLAGDPAGWNVNDTLATHQLAVRVQSSTAIIRQFRARDQRSAGLIRLDEHR